MLDFIDIMSLRFYAMLPQIVAGFVVAGVFWLLARFVGGFVMRFQARVDEAHKDLVGLLADVVGWGMFIIGLIAGLGTAGVNVTALVTGVGLTGFAVGFAMKDILSNLIAGVLIMLLHPYGRGDKVRIDKYQGTVVNVDLRYTTLKAPGAKVLIPNAKAYTDVVVVLSDDAPMGQSATKSDAAPAINVKAAAKPTAAA